MTDGSVIFIGPMGVGKTSAAKKVSEVLGMKYIDIDELRWAYFEKQSDYDAEIVKNLFNVRKEAEAFRYFKPFEARLAVHFLTQTGGGVFDFGAGYSVYEDKALFNKVKDAFSKYKYVIFLRYSEDAGESLEALRGRHAEISDNLYRLLNKEFIESNCNELLATHIVNTKNKTPEQAAASVLEILKGTLP